MAREFSKSFYNSSKWLRCRLSYIEMRFGKCERCNGLGNQVHHKVYLTPKNINDPSITLSFDNLELLCDLCHQNEHHSKNKSTKFGYQFNERGELVYSPPFAY